MTKQQSVPNQHESDMTHDYELRKLILHNDSTNTFEHVITSLMVDCKHENHQAEQCAIIAHYKGKCDVLQGAYVDLQPIRLSLLTKGLNITID